jgi:(1->4)-alpha-D-glucan 1-alpha-D-glucosylmutase
MQVASPAHSVWRGVADEAARRRAVPTSTYRVQFNRFFTFQHALRRVPYWHDLGISHIYASPFLQSRPDSLHGYDICNHNALNPAIGSQEDLQALVDALHERGMGLILDTVPNHMGIGEAGNEYWMDVLENGPSSPFATFFDIDWQPINQELANQVLLPILGDQYGNILERQELKLEYESGAFYIRYWETRLPVAPRTYTMILQDMLERLEPAEISTDPLLVSEIDEHAHVLELQSIITALRNLPPRTETDPELVAERQREKEVIKRRLNSLTESHEPVAAALAATIEMFNGTPGDPRSFDRLDELVRDQAYRLAYWRVAAEEINYRRFFDINDLAAIRMELPEVFERTHRLILQLLADGTLDGLRIDHPDGLWDPAGYFRNLQLHYLLALARRLYDGDDESWPEAEAEVRARYDEAFQEDPHSLIARPLYVVAEKILGHGESLPNDWTVDGTSGYEFLNLVNGVLIDSSNARTFETIYSTFIKQRTNFTELVLAKKRQILLVSLASELAVLAHQLNRLSERNRYYRDFTLNSLTFALREVIACFPVYRTYIADGVVPDEAVRHIETAITGAKRRAPVTDPSIFDFIRDVLLLKYPGTADEEVRREQQDWVQKFQQITGPVMAKGLEDTSFYIYNRLIALNEVGGEPQRFGATLNEFHRANAERLKLWPHAMLTTSTHDTKRSEDVRARIAVLSELPREWKSALSRWSRFNRRFRTRVEGRSAPDRNEEYLLYQTLLGVWPFEWLPESQESGAETIARQLESIPGDAWNTVVERIVAYMQKALKEAKVNTSWVNPNQPWDDAVATFVRRVLERRRDNQFLPDLAAFAGRIARHGAWNALAQTAIKLTAPGMPDVYQGNEMWDLSLVDPDNRRPVDYDARERSLRELLAAGDDSRPALIDTIMTQPFDGRLKLLITARLLRLRRDQPDLFAAGAYAALQAEGPRSEHVIAFARRLNGRELIVVAPRLTTRLCDAGAAPTGDVWSEDRLRLPAANGAKYVNVLTGESLAADGDSGLSLAHVLAHLPVAVLIKESPDD